MLSLFTHWKKSKADPNSRCSSQPAASTAASVENAGVGLNDSPDKDNGTDKSTADKPVTATEAVSSAENTEAVSPSKEEQGPILGGDLSLRDRIELALHTVYDPEIPVNIMELGLVYKIDIKEDNTVFVVMTLTAPACPVAGDIVIEVENKVAAIAGVKEAHVQLTFDPPWDKDMMSEEAKLELGFM